MASLITLDQLQTALERTATMGGVPLLTCDDYFINSTIGVMYVDAQTDYDNFTLRHGTIISIKMNTDIICDKIDGILTEMCIKFTDGAEITEAVYLNINDTSHNIINLYSSNTYLFQYNEQITTESVAGAFILLNPPAYTQTAGMVICDNTIIVDDMGNIDYTNGTGNADTTFTTNAIYNSIYNLNTPSFYVCYTTIDDYVKILTRENGKCFSERNGEVIYILFEKGLNWSEEITIEIPSDDVGNTVSAPLHLSLSGSTHLEYIIDAFPPYTVISAVFYGAFYVVNGGLFEIISENL